MNNCSVIPALRQKIKADHEVKATKRDLISEEEKDKDKGKNRKKKQKGRKNMQGRPLDSSAGKSTCCQAWWPNFYPIWEKDVLFSGPCILTMAHAQTHTYIHANIHIHIHTYIHIYILMVKKIKEGTHHLYSVLWTETGYQSNDKPSRTQQTHCCAPSGMRSWQSRCHCCVIHPQWHNPHLESKRSVQQACLQLPHTLHFYFSLESRLLQGTLERWKRNKDSVLSQNSRTFFLIKIGDLK